MGRAWSNKGSASNGDTWAQYQLQYDYNVVSTSTTKAEATIKVTLQAIGNWTSSTKPYSGIAKCQLTTSSSYRYIDLSGGGGTISAEYANPWMNIYNSDDVRIGFNKSASDTWPSVNSSIWNDIASVTYKVPNITKTTSTQYIYINGSTASTSINSANILLAQSSGTHTDAWLESTATITIPPLSYEVSYNANGGSGAPSSQMKVHGENLTLSSTIPTRSGYSFVHWNTSAAGTGSSYAPGATYSANVATTLYAIWTPVVSYNANGGSGAPASQVKPLNEPLTLSATTPTRTGFKFASWNTASDGSGATYYPSGSFSGTAPTILYAIWDYALTIGTMTVERAAQSGDADVMGRYLKCSIPWSTDSADNGTQATFTSGSVSQTVTLTGTSGTATALLNVGALPTADYSASVTVTDSLGASKSASAITTAASTGYTQPAILNMTVTRSDSTGEPEDGGEYALLEFDWSVAAVGSQTKPQSLTVTAYDGSAVVDSDTVTTFSAATGYYSHVFGYGSTFNAEKTYLFTAVLEDRASSATKSEVLSIAYFTFDVLAGGHGVAFGKPSTTAELMDVGYEIHSDVEVSAIDSNDVVHNLTEKADKTDVDALETRVDGMVTGVSGVKGNAESAYRSGNVNLTPADIGAVSGVKGDAETSYRSGDVNITYPNLGTAPIANGGTGATTRKNGIFNLLWLGTNPTGGTANDTRAWWAERSPCIAFFSATGQLNGQPSQYGFVISVSNGGSEVHQEWWTQIGTHYRRGANHATGAMPGWTNVDGSSCVPKRTQLYNNATGTTGTVTLSATAANYNHLRIHYRVALGVNDYGSVDVYSPNGKTVDISIANLSSSSGSGSVTHLFKNVTISGTSITRLFEKHYTLTFGTNAWAYSANSNYVYVVRVEGWNE